MGEAGCFAALAWVIVCPYRDRFFFRKNLENGAFALYICVAKLGCTSA